MKPAKELKREPEAIKLMLAILYEMSSRLETGDTLDPDRLDGVAEFIQDFADQRAKEEDSLFPVLERTAAAHPSASLALHPDWKERIAIVIAMLNEEEGLAELLEECKRYSSELIAVDGHSQDRTAEIAARAGALVLTDNGRGKGDALRVAVPHVSKDITIFMDADWSHDPSDIPRLVQPILEGRADHVTGSRLLGGSSELHGGFDEFMRLMGSSFITACIGWRFKQRISDSQNGFRAIKTEVLRDLDLRENITTIEQEMIIKTLRAGYRLAEVPTHEYKRRFKESHIVLRRVWFKYVSSMMKYLFF